MSNTTQVLESRKGSLVVDALTQTLVVLVDVLPNCHWGCEVKRSDGTLAYRTHDEIVLLPTVTALRPLSAAVVA
jgi:hypothetical protein